MASPVEEDGEAAAEALKGSSSQLCGGVKTGDAVGRVRRESECDDWGRTRGAGASGGERRGGGGVGARRGGRHGERMTAEKVCGG